MRSWVTSWDGTRLIIWCSVRIIRDWWSHRECLWIKTWCVYSNALENVSSNTAPCVETISHVIGMYTRYPFWCCGIPMKIPQKTFCAWWHIFNTFLSTRAVYFCTTHGKNKIQRFDTECFVPVASFCGVVGSPYWFSNCLIGRTGNMLSVVYINAKCIYLSETCACTII